MVPARELHRRELLLDVARNRPERPALDAGGDVDAPRQLFVVDDVGRRLDLDAREAGEHADPRWDVPWPIAREAPAGPFLLGVAAGVIGLIAAVTVDIVDTGVVDVPTALLAVGGFLALSRWHGKLTVVYVVLGCGAIGAGLQLSGLAS